MSTHCGHAVSQFRIMAGKPYRTLEIVLRLPLSATSEDIAKAQAIVEAMRLLAVEMENK